MLLRTALVALTAPLAISFCGASDAPPPPPPAANAPTSTAEVTASVALPPASHGGTVLAVEDRPVEVVVASDGTVNAWLPGPPPPPEATLSVQVNTAAGPKVTQMTWDAESAVFVGEVEGAAPRPGPIEIGLTVNGRLRRGHVRRVRVVRPRAVVRVRARPPRPRADVRVDVHAPAPPRPRANVDIEIHGPVPPVPPPPHVRIDVRGPRPPPPPGVRVDIRGGVRVGGMHHHDNGFRDHGEGHGMRHRRGRHRRHDD